IPSPRASKPPTHWSAPRPTSPPPTRKYSSVEHTKITLRNYAGFSFLALTLGVVAVGFGTVDMLMIAPLGLEHLAAIGQGELIVSAIYALLTGVVDIFTSRLAQAEGAATTAMRLPAQAGALMLLLVVCE